MRMNSSFATPPEANVLPKVESNAIGTGGTHAMNHIPEHRPGSTFEKQRGRARGRGQGKVKYEFENMSPGGEGLGVDALSSADEAGPSRKRRRSRKGLERKFECPHKDCGKVYSRAEHLNRHQLNHNAKTIWECDQEGCNRTFVRQDLCNRHKERHESRKSQLGRKDSSMYNPSPSSVVSSNPQIPGGSLSPETLKIEDSKPAHEAKYNPPPENASGAFSPPAASTSEASNTPTSNWFPASNGDQNFPQGHEFSPRSTYPMPGHNGMKPAFSSHERHASYSSAPPTSNGAFMHSPPPPQASQYGVGLDGMQSLSQASPFLNGGPNYNPSAVRMHPNIPQRTIEAQFTPPNYNPTPFLLANGQATQPQGFDSSYSVHPSSNSVPGEFQPNPTSYETMFPPEYNDMVQQYVPMLYAGGEAGFSRSPNAMNPEHFFTSIFFNGDGPISLDGQPPGTYSDIPAQFQFFQHPETGQYQYTRPMAVETILQPTPREHRLSEYKAQDLFNMIYERFNESEESAIAPLKKKLLDGDRTAETHMMSTKKMQHYIELYFDQFHPQIPILHQPTFTADDTHNLLLIAVMAIGASCLDRRHDFELRQTAASLSNFLAWHLRTEAINHRDFRTPSSLWMFQTVLLLELYEKMYSDRLLHERAHIFHASTITLMRRGRSLIDTDQERGQSPVRRDEIDRPRHSPATGDSWWNKFIEGELTRRAAVVAFLIDTTHAVMFGHSTNMFVTELAFNLPCDEKIWAAPTGLEAQRLLQIESKKHSGKGKTSNSFLASIRKIMNGQVVETDTFGRTVLMAGLLGVLSYMKQRDQTFNTLMGNLGLDPNTRDKASKWNYAWRGKLERAFDSWSLQFDKSVSNIFQRPYQAKEELVCESRSVLHHLAHMVMHVDVIDCQVYARATKLLGRCVQPNELREITAKWEERSKNEDTQHAVFYALQYLRSVLMPDHRTGQSQAYNENGEYRARDDPLLNRPWVLYFAALIVWCYGYATEGERHEQPGITPLKHRPGDQIREMQEYLTRFCLPREHDRDRGYLGRMQGLNANSGLLMVVRSCFQNCRWELLREAQKLLTNCIELNAGRRPSAEMMKDTS